MDKTERLSRSDTNYVFSYEISSRVVSIVYIRRNRPTVIFSYLCPWEGDYWSILDINSIKKTIVREKPTANKVFQMHLAPSTKYSLACETSLPVSHGGKTGYVKWCCINASFFSYFFLSLSEMQRKKKHIPTTYDESCIRCREWRKECPHNCDVNGKGSHNR